MNKIEFSFERKKIEELTHRQKEVIETAKNACDKSYSPYSHFSVGAAVEMENGERRCRNQDSGISMWLMPSSHDRNGNAPKKKNRINNGRRRYMYNST